MTARLLIALIALLAMSGCSAITDRKSGVSVSGLNYTDTGFSYVVKDPNDPNSGAGGESISPYGGGGVMCCYGLPPEWRPGIQVKVKIYQYDYDERKEKLVKEVLAEVPPYAKGKPGTLWAVLYPDGSVEAISSDVTPDHPEWPGKIKGWPEPSRAYLTKLWEQEVKAVESAIKMYNELMRDLDSPEKMKESWKHDMKYNRDEIKEFSGPGHSAYIDWLQKRYDEGLSFAYKQLEYLQRKKP